MKKRIITLLLALVLVVSLLPVGVLAARTEPTIKVDFRGQRWQWPSRDFTMISRSLFSRELVCQKCKENMNHTGNHAVLASDIKALLPTFQATVDRCTYYDSCVVIGISTQNDYENDKAPSVHIFDEYQDTDCIELLSGNPLYYIAVPVSGRVDVNCVTEDSGHETKTYNLTKGSFTAMTTGKNAAGEYTCTLTITKEPYVSKYNTEYTETHKDTDPETTTVTLDLYSYDYDDEGNKWWRYDARPQINVKCAPDKPIAETDGLAAVKVNCSTLSAHTEETYFLDLANGTYTLGDVVKGGDGAYTCTGTVVPDTYVTAYSNAYGTHALTGGDYTFVMTYDKALDTWKLTKFAEITVKCAPAAPANPEAMLKVMVACTADESHAAKLFDLADGDTVTLGMAEETADGGFVLNGTVTYADTDAYVKPYNDQYGEHEIDDEKSTNAFQFTWDKTTEQWTLASCPLIAVKCPSDGYNPVSPILAALNKTAPKLNTRDHFAYVQGYPDGTVRPNGSVTRAETAAILFRLMDASSRSLYYSTAAGFRDVDSTKWYNTYVATLNNAGVITDSRDGYFRPDAAITRAELAAMLAQFTEQKSAAIYFSDVSAGHWAAKAIALTADLGWINGYPDGTFGPDKTVTRAELMAMINRATGRAPKSADALLTGMKTWKDNANTGAWYYLDVQEATNSHSYMVNPTEYWTGLEADPNWAQYE